MVSGFLLVVGYTSSPRVKGNKAAGAAENGEVPRPSPRMAATLLVPAARG